MIVHTSLQELRQNINQRLNPQKTPHTSHWRACYGVSFVNILEKIGRVITAQHYVFLLVKTVFDMYKCHILEGREVRHRSRSIEVVSKGLERWCVCDLKSTFPEFFFREPFPQTLWKKYRPLYIHLIMAAHAGGLAYDEATRPSAATMKMISEIWSF